MLACKKYGQGNIYIRERCCDGASVSDSVDRVFPLQEFSRFSASYRYNACWMQVSCGYCPEDRIPKETQFLLLEKEGGYRLVYALAAERARASLYSEEGTLYVKTETGESKLPVAEAPVVYCIEGDDPYALARLAAADICALLGTCLPRNEKVVPAFCDMLGFCTYNSFGSELSEDKIINVLRQFADQGIRLGFVIFDEGWQSAKDNRLHSFAADPKKFPQGLIGAIQNIKRTCGIKEILVWHTFDGYWAGVDKESFADYKAEEKYFPCGKEEKDTAFQMTVGEDFFPENLGGIACGVPIEQMFRFYFDWHSHLRREGADGVKVDAMGWLEAFSENSGGRSALYRNMMSSLEGSALLNFDGEIINCSGCVNDIFYHSLKTAVMRTSSDYLVDDDASHGRHVYTNAVVSFWLNEWFVTDWDMFQSGNTAGEFHAIARVLSGGPIYCTDDARRIRADILRRLHDAEGRVPRCLQAGMPAKDCLFFDPRKAEVPFKIFNRSGSGFLMGAFHCSETEGSVKGCLRAADALAGGKQKYAVHSLTRGYLGIYGAEDAIPVCLNKFEAELFRFQPVEDGFACFGLVDKYNSEGFIRRREGAEVEVTDDGIFGYVTEENGRFIYRQFHTRKGKIKMKGGKHEKE